MTEARIRTTFERTKPAQRPTVRGTRAMVASGHHLATLAAWRILEHGGNAVDAGVAAGICLGVLQSDMVNFGGVAPIAVHMAGTRRVKQVAGLGGWPRGASVQLFRERGLDVNKFGPRLSFFLDCGLDVVVHPDPTTPLCAGIVKPPI